MPFTRITDTMTIPFGATLLGEVSLLPNLPRWLGDRLGIPVGHFDPLKEVRVSTSCSDEKLEMDKAFLAEAIGIAIGAVFARLDANQSAPEEYPMAAEI